MSSLLRIAPPLTWMVTLLACLVLGPTASATPTPAPTATAVTGAGSAGASADPSVAPSVAQLARLSSSEASSTADPRQALETGNELFQSGDIEAAARAYLSGWNPEAPHPTLVYNLATTLHHLDHLPEAILWYKRGDADDPWLEENLWLARRSLGSQRLPLGGFVGWLVNHRRHVFWASVIAAWTTLLLAFGGRGLARKLLWVGLVLALGLYSSAWAIEAYGPRAAVLVEDCETPVGDLPAGTEAWVRQDQDGWRVAGSNAAICPQDSLRLVSPRNP